ncbi:MAG: oligosaccharide flippase family protein, partial [Chitinispirillia bacterium]
KTNIASSFILLVSISAVCYYGMPIVYILYANAAIELLKSLIMLIVYFRFTSKTPFAPDFQKYIEILKYCTPLILSTITLLFAKRIDGLIVSKMMDPKSYAVFSYGALELPLGPLIVMNIAALTMPVLVRFYSNNRFGDITEILLKEIRRITLILFPLFFGFLLIYQEFIVFLYSEEYIGSVPVFFVYLFLLPLQLYAFNTVIQAMNMTSANLFITNVALATNVTVSLILIKPLGIVGPAIGTIIAIFIEKFMTLRIIHKKLGNSIKKWLPWKYLMQLTLSCAIPFTILLLLVKPSLPETHLTKILTLFGIYMVITPLILWYANLLEKEDKETLLVYIRKIPVLKRIFVG